ncbi:MAG: hypothetical protein J0I41_21005 [Filimonas sp.]|nr:hypothetical protein [Filimonas sp.]
MRLTFIPRTLLFILLLAAGVIKGYSQQATDKLAQALTDSLGYLQLSDAQKTQALGFNKTAAASLVQTAQKAKQDTTFKGKAVAKQVMGIMKQRNTALTGILNDDQKKLMQAHKIEQAAELQTKMMTAQLDLTDEQVPQVYQVNLKETQEMMGDAAKLKGAKRKLQKFKAAKALKSDSKDKDKELKKILTSDQYSKYEKSEQEMQAMMKEKMKEKKG